MICQTTERSTWKPPPELTVSQWAERHRFLSAESSAEPGRWRNERTPFTVGVMDAVNDPRVRRVTVKSAAQMLKTEFINNVIGYFIDQDACPILMIQPTENMATSWVKERFNPMIRDCPCFQDKIIDDTQVHKTFIGGFLAIGWAKSAASLASRPVRVVLFDEVDRYDLNVKKEGDPINQGTKRTTTFHNRLIIAVSTPNIKGSSRIDALYDEGDQRQFLVPCPNCNDFHALKWEDIEFDPADALNSAKWACPGCAAKVEHVKKKSMVANGYWEAQMPFVDHASFHINSLYSPWKTWGEIAKDYMEAKKTEETKQTWWNLELGLSYEPKMQKADSGALIGLCEPYDAESIPNGILWLAAGVDTQNDRFEIDVWGYGFGQEAWHVETKVILGDPKRPETTDALNDFLLSTWQREDGHRLNLGAAYVDSGGNRTDAVYKFCRGKSGRRIFAIKGASSKNPFDSNIEVTKQGRSKNNKVTLVIIHTAKLKKQLYDDFDKTVAAASKTEDGERHSGQGLYHFGKNCNEDFFKQLTAEKLIRKRVGNKIVYEWRHDPAAGDYERNERLDNAVYARAALLKFNPNFELLQKRIDAQKAEKPEEKEEKPENFVKKQVFIRKSSKKRPWVTSY